MLPGNARYAEWVDGWVARQPENNNLQHDENTDRVALQRRHPIDDQWVNPHNPCLAMFANASIHVLPFALASVARTTQLLVRLGESLGKRRKT